MESIEKLRGLAKRLDDKAVSMSEHGFSPVAIKMEQIADEIEREISERYMLLPVDADGVPIHVGDDIVTDTQTKVRGMVRGIALTPSGWEIDIRGFGFMPSEAHHYKPRTIEDILALFLTACGDDDPHYYDEQIAEYADELRGMGVGE